MDDDTLQAVRKLWQSDNAALPAIVDGPPKAGRLKSPQPSTYAQIASKKLRRESAGTGGAWHDYRSVTIKLYGLKADVVKAVGAVNAVFNSACVFVYPSGARFIRWWDSDGGDLDQDPATKGGQDVWVGTITGEVWSIREDGVAAAALVQAPGTVIAPAPVGPVGGWEHEPVAGDPITTPASIAGLKLWLDATKGLYQDSLFTTPAVLDADPVGGWQDQSGLGNHVIQTVAGKRPTLKLAFQNGRSVLRFDGVDDFLSNAAPTWGAETAYTIFCVTSVVSATTFGMHYVPTEGGNEMRQFGGTGKPNFDFNGLDVPAGAANLGGWNIWEASAANVDSSYDFSLDGVSQGSGVRSFSASSTLSLGARAAGGNPANCRTAELLHYSAALTPAQKVLVRAYLKNRWATP